MIETPYEDLLRRVLNRIGDLARQSVTAVHPRRRLLHVSAVGRERLRREGVTVSWRRHLLLTGSTTFITTAAALAVLALTR